MQHPPFTNAENLFKILPHTTNPTIKPFDVQVDAGMLF
jgi:hypothetical protein